ncbi:hypothetical protein Y032_0094g2723 [Ancylostoma ceylanicum]|uniref:Uncharacterized protein n=1 Tax=Ancylostoma ceylanicum TaxID=53326 RepID=A0A016TK40_9BILA|nr:hypothetical protein Y032_0094g2723 [Ancylostoma ceylanicum]
MGGVLAGELCSTRRKCLPHFRGFRRKLRRMSRRRSSNTPKKLVFYDVRNFTLAELSLLMKKHDENGACRSTIYQFEGGVHVLQPDQLFQKSSHVTSRTATLTARTPESDGVDKFRILLVSEYEDPFYLRTMALQLEHLEAAEVATTSVLVQSFRNDGSDEAGGKSRGNAATARVDMVVWNTPNEETE